MCDCFTWRGVQSGRCYLPSSWSYRYTPVFTTAPFPAEQSIVGVKHPSASGTHHAVSYFRSRNSHTYPSPICPVRCTRFTDDAELQVTFILESVLNKNPLRRLSLDRLAELLGSETLWATADAPRQSLAGNVAPILDEVNELLTSTALDTIHGKWWESPCFAQPWWHQSPNVALMMP